MSIQLALRIDDDLAEAARAEAEAAGTTLSDLMRRALRREVNVALARRAREQEDARSPLYTDEQEDLLMDERAQAALDAFAGRE